MKKIKIFAVAAAVVLTVGVLAGCGSGSSSKSSDEVWSNIQKNKTITIGTENAYSPYAYRDKNQKMKGFDVEVAEAVADKMGLKVKWMDTKWDSLISGLDAKKCDVVMDQIAITKERKAKYIFSKPYNYTYGGLMVTPSSGIKSFKDVKGKTFAETATSNWNGQVQKLGGKITKTTGFSDSVQLLEQNRADAMLIENLTELDYLKKNPDSKLKIVDTTDTPIETAVMMRKGSTTLQKKVNKAITELQKDGTLKKISMKYFGKDVTKKNQ
ncbi:MAG: transporter substrate-binding domain-containing protein [Eubacterium sp.]